MYGGPGFQDTPGPTYMYVQSVLVDLINSRQTKGINMYARYQSYPTVPLPSVHTTEPVEGSSGISLLSQAVHTTGPVHSDENAPNARTLLTLLTRVKTTQPGGIGQKFATSILCIKRSVTTDALKLPNFTNNFCT